MLSILIPEYNYNCVKLVNDLHKQCIALDIIFEILVFDDKSTQHKDKNREINSLSHCKLIESDKNLGRAEARNQLSNLSKYNYNLFIDSDALVDNNNYVSNYLKNIDKADIIVGGYKYLNTPPSEKAILRWKYGYKREQIESKNRNKTPFSSFISFNFIAKKNIFKVINFKNNIENKPTYGHEDTLFGIECEKYGISIYNIENPLVHLNIVKNETYLKNSLLACEKILIDKEFQKKEVYSKIKIFRIFMRLKKTHLAPLFSFFYKAFEKPMKKNLFSHNPNIHIFDLYRLSYICNRNHKKTHFVFI